MLEPMEIYRGFDESYGEILGGGVIADRFHAIADKGKQLHEAAVKERELAEKQAQARQELLEAEAALRAVTEDTSILFDEAEDDRPWSYEELQT